MRTALRRVSHAEDQMPRRPIEDSEVRPRLPRASDDDVADGVAVDIRCIYLNTAPIGRAESEECLIDAARLAINNEYERLLPFAAGYHDIQRVIARHVP